MAYASFKKPQQVTLNAQDKVIGYVASVVNDPARSFSMGQSVLLANNSGYLPTIVGNVGIVACHDRFIEKVHVIVVTDAGGTLVVPIDQRDCVPH